MAMLVVRLTSSARRIDAIHKVVGSNPGSVNVGYWNDNHLVFPCYLSMHCISENYHLVEPSTGGSLKTSTYLLMTGSLDSTHLNFAPNDVIQSTNEKGPYIPLRLPMLHI